MEKNEAYFTHSDEHGHLYYFAPSNRAKPPYTKQRVVKAIVDIADDGTLAGVELIDDMPPPPTRASTPASADWRPIAELPVEIRTKQIAIMIAWREQNGGESCTIAFYNNRTKHWDDGDFNSMLEEPHYWQMIQPLPAPPASEE